MKIFEIKKITNEECEKLCKEQPNFPYVVDENSLAIVENHRNYYYKTWLSQRIEIIKILKDEDSNDKSIEIKAYTHFGEEIINISMSMLNKREFSTLQQKWSFNEKAIELIIKYILIQCQNAKTIVQYSTVGWFKYKDDLLFRTNRVITDYKDIQSIYQYNGNFQLEPKIYNNDYNLYIDYLNKALVTSGSMFAVVVGLSSALVSLLKHSIQIENIFIHLFGDSSSGKSTFLKLAVSMWGNPTSPPLVSEWNSTVNAIYATLSGNLGICCGIDEASCSNSDFSTLIYNISHGRDKAKCNKDSSLRKEKTWQTTIISTAEESLLDKTKRNNGIKARCLEFFNLDITQNSNHADYINNFIIQNYGILGEKFVELLYKKSINIIINDYNICRKYFEKKIQNKTNISDRLIKTYAVLLQTAIYIKKLDIAIESIMIVDILIEHHNSMIENSNPVNEIINIITDYVVSHKNRFPTIRDCSSNYDMDCEGVIQDGKLYIIDTIFKEIILKNKFSDFTLVKKWLFNNGYLEKHHSKYYKYKIINGIKTKCYEIKINMLKTTDLSFTGKELEKHRINLNKK